MQSESRYRQSSQVPRTFSQFPRSFPDALQLLQSFKLMAALHLRDLRVWCEKRRSLIQYLNRDPSVRLEPAYCERTFTVTWTLRCLLRPDSIVSGSYSSFPPGGSVKAKMHFGAPRSADHISTLYGLSFIRDFHPLILRDMLAEC